MTRPNTHARVVDALNRLDEYARDYSCTCDAALAVRHLVEALDRVLRNNPTTAEFLEDHVAQACAAVGVEGPLIGEQIATAINAATVEMERDVARADAAELRAALTDVRESIAADIEAIAMDGRDRWRPSALKAFEIAAHIARGGES